MKDPLWSRTGLQHKELGCSFQADMCRGNSKETLIWPEWPEWKNSQISWISHSKERLLLLPVRSAQGNVEQWRVRLSALIDQKLVPRSSGLKLLWNGLFWVRKSSPVQKVERKKGKRSCKQELKRSITCEWTSLKGHGKCLSWVARLFSNFVVKTLGWGESWLVLLLPNISKQCFTTKKVQGNTLLAMETVWRFASV